MDKHVTVISYRGNLDLTFEEVTFAARHQTPHWFVRCQRVVNLHESVARTGRHISCLDLVGHGSPRSFWLGDEILLQSGSDARPELSRLAPLLREDATIRLLGCLTGVGKEGLEMLRSVSGALEGREVLGTTSRLEPRHFGPNGLLESYSRFTSTHALTEAEPEAPNPEDVHESDRELAHKWQELFPGYLAAGRHSPLARTDFQLQFQGVRVTFACDYRLMVLQDDPSKKPFLLCWSSSNPVPISQLLKSAGWTWPDVHPPVKS